mmetsp:Transcript_7227/g.21998  ORF Transcript_7227/g.21998 Transcript_7227/m.21998 type:complete len:232 (-) Transcript_7227:46-741(-)
MRRRRLSVGALWPLWPQRKRWVPALWRHNTHDATALAQRAQRPDIRKCILKLLGRRIDRRCGREVVLRMAGAWLPAHSRPRHQRSSGAPAAAALGEAALCATGHAVARAARCRALRWSVHVAAPAHERPHRRGVGVRMAVGAWPVRHGHAARALVLSALVLLLGRKWHAAALRRRPALHASRRRSGTTCACSCLDLGRAHPRTRKPGARPRTRLKRRAVGRCPLTVSVSVS